ncbi:aldehyde dehydrogenase family protein [Mycobacterium tuberculosis]|nr:aldehyde dehydrogenase family protein [Mycobacterium tuberculosis]
MHPMIPAEYISNIIYEGPGADSLFFAAEQLRLMYNSANMTAKSLVARLGELLTAHQQDLATLVTVEVGKITAEARGEVQEMIDVCQFSVGLSRQLYGRTIASERAGHRLLETWHPLGVVGVITAFNFPVAVWAWNTAVALVLIALGLAEFVAGGLVGGVWLAFIGWFIFAAAREEETRISTQQLFAGVRVADAMTAQPHTAPGWINVEDFIQRYVLGERHSAYPVADRDGSITGLVALRQLRDVAPSRRSTTSVGDIALPLHSVPTARPQEPLTALLERMAPLGPRSRALVTEGSAVVGIVTPSDVARLIDVYRLAQPEPTFTTSPQDADRFSDAG